MQRRTRRIRPFDVALRAYVLGYAIQTLPAVARVVIAWFSRNTRSLLPALSRGVRIKSLATAFALAFGGARLLEPLANRLVRSCLPSPPGDDEEARSARERRSRAISTFCSALTTSLAAIVLLQARQSLVSQSIDFAVTPYAAPAAVEASAAPAELTPTDSSTLDLTLLIFVRAGKSGSEPLKPPDPMLTPEPPVDACLRFLHDTRPPKAGRSATVRRVFAEYGDAIVFWCASWQIMRCWFNKPHLLPKAYSKWIMRLSRMDPNVLQLLRFAREKRFVYGSEADPEVLRVCRSAAARARLSPSALDPSRISRIDCSLVHASIGAKSCHGNAVQRWLRAFLDAFAIYLPVHAVPLLLFRTRRLWRHPRSGIFQILEGASRSSAFLATFVASIYTAVCLVRTQLPRAIPGIPQQRLDGGSAVQAGCLVCGLSILLENKHRRKEMALYTAPRALYCLLDEVVPAAWLSTQLGRRIGTWTERLVFSASSATVITAAVHRPALVSGVVRGVTSFAVGDWSQDS
ncbi:hypothetical protein BMF94_5702 [Rhodotorula taiwanensis]|uniref:Transmembrane protein 135 N-terminal domain-containing protein n=1 Tax=Rhodotorula taiwanensis TaxID=741276 RepID=A0A2S5B3P1_9BASI|nr:hypothetical protein BMF94_5702 [Rhodotorula taiwanensis]